MAAALDLPARGGWEGNLLVPSAIDKHSSRCGRNLHLFKGRLVGRRRMAVAGGQRITAVGEAAGLLSFPQ